MRRTMQVLGAVLLLLASAAAAGAQRLDVGLKGGLTRSTFGGSDATGVKARTGFGAGGFLTVQLTQSVAFQLELLYLRKGVGMDTVAEDLSISGGLQLDYVEVPLLLRFAVPNGTVRPHVMAGPAVAFKARCRVNAQALGFSVSGDCADAEIRSTDFLLAGGAGVNVDVGRGTLVLDARYDHGLRSIDASADHTKVYNRTFVALAGFSIPVGAHGATAVSIR